MKLKKQYTQKTDIPVAYQPLFVEKDGLWMREDVEFEDEVTAWQEEKAKLVRSLENEKEQRRKAIEELTTTRERYKDIDPDKARDAQTKVDELEESKLKSERKYEELALRKFEKAEKNYQEQITQLTKALETEKSTRATTEQKMAQFIINAKLSTAAEGKGVHPKMVKHVVKLTGDNWRLDGDNETVVLIDPVTAVPIYGKDPTKKLTPDEFYEDLPRQDPTMANFYAESTGSGALNSNHANGQGTIVLT